MMPESPRTRKRLAGRFLLASCLAIGTSAPASAQYITARDLLSRQPVAPDFTVAYGADPNQFGHLRVPDGPGPHPVVVLIHGGCWLSFADLDYFGPLAEDLTRGGVATWSLEYRRVDDPGGGWPNTFLDVAAGVDHLRSLESTHDLDLSRVVVVGHSSGGHLALWVAARPRIPATSPLYVADPLPVSAVVSLAGPGQLARFRDLDNRVCGGDVVDTLVGGSPEAVPSHYAAASPVRMLPLGVPQRLLTGLDDSSVPVSFADSYARAAREAGDDAVSLGLEGAAHFEPVVPGSGAWPTVRQAILALVGGVRRNHPGP